MIGLEALRGMDGLETDRKARMLFFERRQILRSQVPIAPQQKDRRGAPAASGRRAANVFEHLLQTGSSLPSAWAPVLPSIAPRRLSIDLAPPSATSGGPFRERCPPGSARDATLITDAP